MQWLTDDDLKTYSFGIFIIESKNDFAEVDASIEAKEIAYIKSKLANRYDTDVIFSATEDERHPLIIKVLSILVLYQLIRRNSARKVAEDFYKDWEWANKWLNDVRDGKETPTDLPLLSDNNENNTAGVKYGNNSNKDYYI